MERENALSAFFILLRMGVYGGVVYRALVQYSEWRLHFQCLCSAAATKRICNGSRMRMIHVFFVLNLRTIKEKNQSQQTSLAFVEGAP